MPVRMCERSMMNAMGCFMRPRGSWKRGLPLLAFVATVFSAAAETMNPPTFTNAPAAIAPARMVAESTHRPVEVAQTSASSPRGFDESAFRIVAERNIFNANRSGGQVRLSSSRRPARVESFTLVGTMAYEKGAFAFFDGSSSEFSKAVKTGGVIAGYKIVDVLVNAAKLEADGKIIELPIGSAMRREDEGTWRLGEAADGNAGTTYAPSRESSHSSRHDSNGRSSRTSGREPGLNNGSGSEAPTTANANSSNGQPESSARSKPDKKDFNREEKQERKELKKELKMDAQSESEVLKRLMERREKEAQ
jgi:hypothetical protein